MRRTRSARLLFLLLPMLALATLAGLLADAAGPGRAAGADDDQGTVASLLSWALSTPANRVSVGAVSGALSSDVEIRDLSIADRNGVWLTVDRARLVWSRTALLARKLDIDRIELDKVTIARRPAEDEAGKAAAADAPALPDLPVKLIVRAFDLKELALGEPVMGQAARLTATGLAVLGKPSEGLTLKLDGRRLDAPGTANVNLAYVPTSGQLDLVLQLKEPEHGLLAKAGGLPGEPPIDLNVNGHGLIDNWAATLAFVSGPTVGAEGRATVKKEATARRVALDLKARIEGLLPPVAAPAFAGTTTLAGDVLVPEAGGFAFERFEIASQTARLTLGGGIDPQQGLDLALAIRAIPTDGTTTRAGAASIGRLVLDLTAKGPVTAPRIMGSLAAADIVSPVLRIGGAQGRIAIEPPASQPATGDAVAAAALSTLAADLDVTGFVPADPDVAAASGDRIQLTARGTALSNLTFDVQAARLATPTLATSFTGTVGSRVIKGRADARIPRLAAFSGLAGRPLTGSADLVAGLDGDPGRFSVKAQLDGKLQDAGIGAAPVDRLLSGTVAIKGTLERLPGGFGFSGLDVAGPHLAARLEGPATTSAADLRLEVTVPDLRRADDRLSGKATGRGRLTGSLVKPDLEADLVVSDARSMGRPIPRLALALKARDLTGALDARATITGEVDRKPLDGRLHATRQGEAWTLDDLAFSLGSVRLGGAVALAANRLATGQVKLAAGDLADLEPLLLMSLKGDVQAAVTLATPGGRQDAHVEARSTRLDVAGQSLRKLDAVVDARDLRGKPVVDAKVAADQVEAGGARFETVRLTSTGAPEASAFALTAKGYGLDLETRGRLLPGPPLGIDLQMLEARRGAQRLALAEPARFTLVDGGVSIDRLLVAAGAGRLQVAGKAGKALDLTAQASAVPLALADLVSPGLGLSGTLDGKVQLGGTADRPTGSYALQVVRASTRELQQAGLPPIDARASGTLGGGRATVDASLTAPRVGTVTVAGSVPVGAGALDLRVRGPLDAAAANAMLAGAGQRLTGRVVLDLAVGGEMASPRLSGTAQLTGGTFEDVLNGVSLKAIEARLAGQGQVVSIERFSAATANGGTLSASGRITVDPAAGFPADIRITGRKAQLVSSDVVSAVADLDMTLSGPLAQAPRIGGRVGILSLDIQIPERMAQALAPLPGTVYVKPGPTARARLAALKTADRQKGAKPAFVATFDLAIEAVNRIFVRGRGLEAELGGSLRLTGTTREPVAIGAFALRRGRIDLAGQRIDLVRGRVTFEGDLTPSLDFLAQTQAADVTAQILVTGRADEPSFTITSQPAMPQDEVLSRLLFARAAGGLTGFQALQLAQTLATLSGGGGGFDKLRKSLGVDSLDVTAGTSGGPAVGVSRYLGPKLRLGVRAGATAADTGVGLDYDVTRRIKLRGQVGADGSTSVGGAVEWEY